METGTALLPISARQHHLALVCGLPSSPTYFVADLCRDLLAREHGACEIIVLNELGAETRDKIAAATGPVAFLAEVPDAAVAELARKAEFPILVIDQGFAAASRDFMAARGTALVDTARTMARAQIGLGALADIPRATVLSLEDADQASVLAERMAVALGLATDIVQQLIRDRDLERPLSDLLNETFAYEKLSPDEDTDEVLAKLDSFYGFHPDHPPTTLEVPIAALLEAQAPHLSATNAIELAGPARCLTFGPYFHLPRGRWEARFTFLATENMSTNTLGFDITSDQEIKVDRAFEIGVSGKFAFDCEFEICDPYSPLEFRTFLRRGSIEGKFKPLSLTLKRCGNGSNRTELLAAE